ncbi:MAG: ABC transporter substrate-binding protein [Lachnospiraceae bacterium]|nr:ABC transporter substrate-binding protein [Lachnospiraceae bacterium]
MRKKALSVVLCSAMMMGSLSTAAVAVSADAAEEVAISFYTTETGKDDYFQDLIRDFEEKNPGITVEYIPAGDDQLQAWMALYAGETGPTVSLMDPINIYENQERMLSLTDQGFVSNVNESALSTFTFGGDVYGIPMSAAGVGILYNKAVCDEAVGGEFDPASIKTRSDLEDLFQKIEAIGKAGTCFTGVNWSLGAHFLCQTYGAANGDVDARVAYVNSIIKGETKEIESDVFNGYMDTFDMMAKYNLNKEDPLVGDVNIDAMSLADGDCGTWFMGDWAWTYLASLVEEGAEFGLLPVPYSDDENDTINQCIATSYAKGYCVDKSQNTEAQQAAGLKFIDYIVNDSYAQEQTAVVTGQALPYNDFDAADKLSPLGASTSAYVAAGKTFDFYGTANLCPSDIWYECGAYMCEYLSGNCDRETLAGNIDAYWGNQEER